MKFHRRSFLRHTRSCLAATATASWSTIDVSAGEDPAAGARSDSLPQDWRSIYKFDCHMHIRPIAGAGGHGDADVVIEAANALGISQLCASRPTSQMASPDAVRQANDLILAAMRRHPGRILGYCFLIPGYAETIPELQRCLDAGMMGVKLYNQFKYSDPICYPIVEHCIERGVPILGHAGHLSDLSELKKQPNISDAAEFCKVADRYPEAMLIHAHICGGGDWEWSVKRLRDCRSVYLDTSGSVLDEHTIELAVDTLGHQRILFGTDTLLETGVGKILSARLTAEQRAAIFSGNMQAILLRRKP